MMKGGGIARLSSSDGGNSTDTSSDLEDFQRDSKRKSILSRLSSAEKKERLRRAVKKYSDITISDGSLSESDSDLEESVRDL